MESSSSPLILSSWSRRRFIPDNLFNNSSEANKAKRSLQILQPSTTVFRSDGASDSISLAPTLLDTILSPLPSKSNNEFHLHPEYNAYVDEDVLRHLSIYEGDFVLCKIASIVSSTHSFSTTNSVTDPTSRLVRLLIAPNDKKKSGSVGINPILWFALRLPMTSELGSIRLTITVPQQRVLGPGHRAWNLTATKKTTKTSSAYRFTTTEISLPTASNATIARICSSDSNSEESYIDILMDYFDKPRVVVEGDVIALLSTQKGGEKKIANSSPFCDQPRVIMFQVIAVNIDESLDNASLNNIIYDCPTTMVIDRNTTKLTQGNVGLGVHRFTPNNFMLTSMLCSVDTTTINRRFCRPTSSTLSPSLTTSKTFNQVYDVVSPCFHSDTSAILSNAILLSGPRGVGKCATVDDLASKLGVSVMTVNYRTKIESTRDVACVKACEKLKEYILLAKKSAPCILHIRRFHAKPSTDGQVQNKDGAMNIALTVEKAIQQCARESVTSNGNNCISRTKSVFIIFSCSDVDDVDSCVRGKISHEVVMSQASTEGRCNMLQTVHVSIHGERKDNEEAADSATRRTAGRSWSDMNAIMAAAVQSALGRSTTLKCPNALEIDTKIIEKNDTDKVTWKDVLDSVSMFKPPGESTVGAVQVSCCCCYYY
jgi:hypothetical protein